MDSGWANCSIITLTNTTYAGIGRVTSEWEGVEVQLSVLYSLFARRFEELEALREYGNGAVFAHRVEKLGRAKDIFFQKMPDQGLEAEYDALVERVRRFADRRHDVAHGIVRPIQWIYPPDTSSTKPVPFSFCVIPPNYKKKHFDPANMPLYVYTRPQLDILQGAIFGLIHEIIQYQLKLRARLSKRK